jgi:LuxR family maltose regulon positive regulatory protein
MLLLIGVCSSFQGELHRAYEYYEQVLSDARGEEDCEVIAQALLGMANISFERNELATVEHQVNEVVTLVCYQEQDLSDRAAFQLALLSYARGQVTSAEQQLAVLLARLQPASKPQASQMLHNVLIWQARLSLERGDLQTAERVLEMLDLEKHLTARIVQARVRLSQDRPHEARIALERLLPVAQQQGTMRDTLEIQVLLALAHAACQQDQHALKWLEQALSQARVEGFVRLFLSEGRSLVRLLRQLIPVIQEPELRSYARTILLTDGAHAPNPPFAKSFLVESLSRQEQRVLRLLATGRTNLEIAQELIVSVNTVKDHVKHLYHKLGVNNRLQASEAARHLKLF